MHTNNFLLVASLEGVHWHVAPDGGGEEDVTRRGISHSHKIAIDKGGRKVPEEDPKEN